MTDRHATDIAADLRDIPADNRYVALLTEAADKLDSLIKLLAEAEDDRDRARVTLDRIRRALARRAAAWRPAQPGDTPGQCEPDDGLPRPIHAADAEPHPGGECRARWKNPTRAQPKRGDRVIECVRAGGHDGDHRDWMGFEWPRPRVCGHCGATDVGAGLPGGYGTVGGVALCHPNSKARLDCYRLALNGHPMPCDRCPRPDFWGRLWGK